MQWTATITNPAPLRAVIESTTFKNHPAGEGVMGYYLYIYEGDNTRCTYDYLQDTFESAKRFALKNFQVPIDIWKRVS